jgi:hypothetical protein
MTKPRTPATIALTVPERVLLFCVASGTEWLKAGVTSATVQHMLVRSLIERDPATMRLALTAQGHDVLAALVHHSGLKLVPPN